ncbi:hypothetical protein PTNB73_02285 [Pyrenophora teres f. teres]|nr:hypothetical protein HRS9122_00383 [Pyrenophora teres f. teres]KAE8873134.1 hypothetical protein PTNB73_02285 [Pyrenophora teres f. teres]
MNIIQHLGNVFSSQQISGRVKVLPISSKNVIEISDGEEDDEEEDDEEEDDEEEDDEEEDDEEEEGSEEDEDFDRNR